MDHGSFPCPDMGLRRQYRLDFLFGHFVAPWLGGKVGPKPILMFQAGAAGMAIFPKLLKNSVKACALFGRGGYIFRDINKLFHTDGDGIAVFFYFFHFPAPVLTASAARFA